MPIALERSGGNRIEGSGFIHGISCVAIYDKSESPHRGVFAVPTSKEGKEIEDNLGDSTSSSSIGKNSELSSDGDDDSGDAEVQSSFNGGPLDSMDALEGVLPIKRGISKFYCGKSKSFTSLADAASSSSIKDLAKPENAYNKKRKNLIASRYYWEKNSLRSSGGGISKRLATNSRSMLSLAVSMGCAESNNSSEDSNSSSFSPPRGLPPLHPRARILPNSGSSSPSPQPSPQRNFSPWRSFSLSDLQGAANGSPSISGLTSKDRDKVK
ncbi:hypothetical protein RJ641_026669 [Dillenia turbinata]|uniref:Uncharacterized protein n=1 Tax=Dillenia turbinata TaxID=194707 RepID=A0AAN8W8Q2_9MAGN